MSDDLTLCATYGLPPLPDPVLKWRFTARTGDWYAQTKAGWFYCRMDGHPENRKWVPSVYGPTV